MTHTTWPYIYIYSQCTTTGFSLPAISCRVILSRILIALLCWKHHITELHWGWGSCVLHVWILMNLWSANEPRPLWKFSDTALRRQRCDWNWNNLWFLHGTATYTLFNYHQFTHFLSQTTYWLQLSSQLSGLHRLNYQESSQKHHRVTLLILHKLHIQPKIFMCGSPG